MSRIARSRLTTKPASREGERDGHLSLEVQLELGNVGDRRGRELGEGVLLAGILSAGGSPSLTLEALEVEVVDAGLGVLTVQVELAWTSSLAAEDARDVGGRILKQVVARAESGMMEATRQSSQAEPV